MDYVTHVFRLPMVVVAHEALGFAFRWTYRLTLLFVLFLIGAYFFSDASSPAEWLSSDSVEEPFWKLILIAASALFVFLTGIDWIWSTKRLIRQSAKRSFFKGLIKILSMIFLVPLFFMPLLGSIYAGYYFLLHYFL